MGLLRLGLTHLMLAQHTIAAVNIDIALSTNKHASSGVKNVDYLNILSLVAVTKRETAFEQVVANYDIKTASSCNPKASKATYNITFSERYNIIEPFYSSLGKLMHCSFHITKMDLKYRFHFGIINNYQMYSLMGISKP